MSHKREVGLLDGTPKKRMFYSIINDYGLLTALCELVDNCVDVWLGTGRSHDLQIEILIDVRRQTILIRDTAGGVAPENLELLISPGGSTNAREAATIGIFGVGSKRAAVALAERVSIRTRQMGGKTFQIDVDDAWLKADEWQIPCYEVEPIDEGMTIVEFDRLRRELRDEDVSELVHHLSVTYARFLVSDKLSLSVNSEMVVPLTFDNWCFPPGFEPNQAFFEVELEDDTVLIQIEAGLISDRNPATENYGVYVYCNDRLIVKELKSRDVGYYVTGEAGIPHPDASLCRVIVQIAGAAKCMPWNSSKDNLNPHHPLFQQISPTIVRLASHFSKLSRSLKKTWDETVFPFLEGEIVEITPEEALNPRSISLPDIPKSRKKRIESIKESNKKQIDRAPYIVGLIEAVAASELIEKQQFETGNRIALILLDSTFEIAVKERLVHDKDLFGREKVDNVLGNRTDSIVYLRSQLTLSDDIFMLAEHYYEMRNKLVHERATVSVSSQDIERYRDAVKRLLTELYYVIW